MFQDYRTWTLNHYKHKGIAGALSPNLKRSSPGKIRTECELVYKERYHKKDEQTLRTFFGILIGGESYGEVIRKFDVDKFKPLDKFLKGTITETEDKNIELLAWLLDIQPRPYQETYTYPTLPIGTKKTPMDSGVVREIAKRQEEKLSKLKKRPVLLGTSILLLAALVGFGTYTLWPKKAIAMTIGGPIPPPAKGACMIWMGDHYEALPCEDRAGRPGVLAIDSGRLAHFRQITDTLMLTERSVGKVWYFKNKGKIEYFTAPGYHPIDTARWLKPLTTYMVRKYLQHPIHP